MGYTNLMITRSLVVQVLAGQKRAQKFFFDQYFGRVENFLRQRGLNEEEVEEIAQETLISAFEALPFYNFRCRLSTWVLAIAKHELVDFYRKRRLKTILFSVLPGLEGLINRSLGPESVLEKQELKRKVKKAFSLLAEGYAQILRLKYIEGLSVRQIACQLEVTEKAAESRLTRARRTFAKVYVIVDQGG